MEAVDGDQVYAAERLLNIRNRKVFLTNLRMYSFYLILGKE
jgi:hypothetical protein